MSDREECLVASSRSSDLLQEGRTSVARYEQLVVYTADRRSLEIRVFSFIRYLMLYFFTLCFIIIE